MNEDIYWQAQWAINVLEEVRHRGQGLTDGEDAALDVLLQLKR